MKCEALGLATVGGDEVDVGVAVVLAGEGDPFAVRGEFWVQLVPDLGGEAPCSAAFAGGDPQVAGINKNDFVLRDVRESQEMSGAGRHLIRRSGLSLGRRGGEAKHDGRCQTK